MESKPTPSEGTPLAGDYGPAIEQAIVALMEACWYRERDNAKRMPRTAARCHPRMRRRQLRQRARARPKRGRAMTSGKGVRRRAYHTMPREQRLRLLSERALKGWRTRRRMAEFRARQLEMDLGPKK